MTSEVIVECKNSPNPLVLVGTNVEKWGPVDDALVVTFDPYSLSFPDTDFKTIDGELHLKRLPGYGPKAAFVGHQLVRMNRASGNWKADNSAVYDSILYPLVKAREYRKL